MDEFKANMMDYLNYVSKNSPDENLKRGATKALEIMNTPKADYTGVQNYISGNKSVNGAKVGESVPNDVLSSIFAGKNKARDEEIANRNAMEAQNRIDMENKAKQDEENTKADKLRKRKMHQQALVSSRVSSGNNQPSIQMPQMPQMPPMGM